MLLPAVAADRVAAGKVQLHVGVSGFLPALEKDALGEVALGARFEGARVRRVVRQVSRDECLLEWQLRNDVLEHAAVVGVLLVVAVAAGVQQRALGAVLFGIQHVVAFRAELHRRHSILWIGLEWERFKLQSEIKDSYFGYHLNNTYT